LRLLFGPLHCLTCGVSAHNAVLAKPHDSVCCSTRPHIVGRFDVSVLVRPQIRRVGHPVCTLAVPASVWVVQTVRLVRTHGSLRQAKGEAGTSRCSAHTVWRLRSKYQFNGSLHPVCDPEQWPLPPCPLSGEGRTNAAAAGAGQCASCARLVPLWPSWKTPVRFQHLQKCETPLSF
jgi:hypothetical protein